MRPVPYSFTHSMPQNRIYGEYTPRTAATAHDTVRWDLLMSSSPRVPRNGRRPSWSENRSSSPCALHSSPLAPIHAAGRFFTDPEAGADEEDVFFSKPTGSYASHETHPHPHVYRLPPVADLYLPQTAPSPSPSHPSRAQRGRSFPQPVPIAAQSPAKTEAPPPPALTPLSSLFTTTKTPGASWTPFLNHTDPVLRKFATRLETPLASLKYDDSDDSDDSDNDLYSTPSYNPLPVPSTPLVQRFRAVAPGLSSPLTPLTPLEMLGVSTISTPASSLPFRAALRDQYGWRRSTPNAVSDASPLSSAYTAFSQSCDASFRASSPRISSPSPPVKGRATRSRSRVPAAIPPTTRPTSEVTPQQKGSTRFHSATTGNKRSRSAESSSDDDDSSTSRKRLRTNSTSTSASNATSATSVEESAPLPRRNFPSDLPIATDLFRLYRRHPASSFVDGGKTSLSSSAVRAEGTWNQPHSTLDLYTPRFTKGVGRTKVGMCPICAEGVSRGGEGRRLFLAMKQSAYNYHMMYYHGISSNTGLPFSPPVEIRTVPHVPRSKIEKNELREGKCHKCARWLTLDTVKRDHDTKVKEQFWWKHAASCHGPSRLTGDEDPFLEDDVHTHIMAALPVEDGDESS